LVPDEPGNGLWRLSLDQCVCTARRRQYLDALEVVSADQNIIPFARFIRAKMNVGWSHEPPRK
jgi:hypothetical protein